MEELPHCAGLGPEESDEALLGTHVKEFDITGRPMNGWVLVEPEGVEDDDQLTDWVRRAVELVEILPAKWARGVNR